MNGSLRHWNHGLVLYERDLRRLLQEVLLLRLGCVQSRQRLLL